MIGGMGFQEMAIIAVVAILLFGKRLPDVAKSFGQSYRQFREGLNDIQRSMSTTDYGNHQQISYTDTESAVAEDYEEPTAPKFELPTSDAKQEASDEADK